MKKIREKYGLVNLIICLLCIIILIINSICVSKNSLYEISDNIIVAYCLNFLAGCQGVLGKWGSMSYETFFVKGQWWRCISHIYLHAGVIHMVAIVDSIITCMIFTSESVGASAGIFGVIGILIILFFKKQILLKKNRDSIFDNIFCSIIDIRDRKPDNTFDCFSAWNDNGIMANTT